MSSYPNEPLTLAQAIETYTPSTAFLVAITDPETPDHNAGEILANALAATALQRSPIVKAVEAYDLLRPLIDQADEDALKILAGAAELIALHNFYGKQDGALGVRDAARDRLAALV